MNSMIKITVMWLFAILLVSGCSWDNPMEPEKTSAWSPMNTGLSETAVKSIAFAPGAVNVLWIGTRNGAYRSMDGGKTWERRSEGLTMLDTRRLIIHPKNPSIVFCGTWGGGVFKTENGGLSWQSVSSAPLNRRIYSMAFAQNGSEDIWVGTEQGLYKSADLGQTWDTILDSGKILSIAMHPGAPQQILIGRLFRGVFNSQDYGKTWSEANSGIYRDDFGYAAPNYLAFNPQNSQEIIASTGYVDLFRSGNGGETWIHFAEKLNGLRTVAIALDPQNPKRIWAATQRNGVYSSPDDGSTWTRTKAGLNTDSIEDIIYIPGRAAAIFVATTEKGVFKLDVAK